MRYKARLDATHWPAAWFYVSFISINKTGLITLCVIYRRPETYQSWYCAQKTFVAGRER